MKYIFLVATLALQFLSVLTLKLLDSFWLIITIFVLSMVVGSVLNFSNRERETTVINKIGWGLFYGSLTSLAIVIIFMVWLSFNFPR